MGRRSILPCLNSDCAHFTSSNSAKAVARRPRAARHRYANGTTIDFNPGRYEPEILRWLDRLDRQARLPLSDPRAAH
jgi:hypothetical protein